MTTVTATPAARPAQAYAWPAFPADSVMTPRARAASGRRRDPVRHPARLERAGLLEMLGLEVEAVVRRAARRSRRVVQAAAVADEHQRRAVDQPDQPLAGRLDVGERDDVVLGFGHRRMVPRQARPGRAAPALDIRGIAGYLRVCASADMVVGMLDRLPVSAEPERLRYAAVGRALADPKRLCVLESLAIGELSVTDLSERVGCQVPNMSQHLAVLRSAGPRDHAARRQHRLLSPRRPAGPRGLSTHPGHRALGARKKGERFPMAEIKVATDANFEELVLKSERPVVVDFWAAWCGPCKMVAPEMEKLADKYDGVGRRRQGRRRRQPGPVAGVQHPEHPGDRLLQARLAAAGRRRVPAARAARADVRPRRVRDRRRGIALALTAFSTRPGHRPGSFQFRRLMLDFGGVGRTSLADANRWHHAGSTGAAGRTRRPRPLPALCHRLASTERVARQARFQASGARPARRSADPSRAARSVDRPRRARRPPGRRRGRRARPARSDPAATPARRRHVGRPDRGIGDGRVERELGGPPIGRHRGERSPVPRPRSTAVAPVSTEHPAGRSRCRPAARRRVTGPPPPGSRRGRRGGPRSGRSSRRGRTAGCRRA